MHVIGRWARRITPSAGPVIGWQRTGTMCGSWAWTLTATSPSGAAPAPPRVSVLVLVRRLCDVVVAFAYFLAFSDALRRGKTVMHCRLFFAMAGAYIWFDNSYFMLSVYSYLFTQNSAHAYCKNLRERLSLSWFIALHLGRFSIIRIILQHEYCVRNLFRLRRFVEDHMLGHHQRGLSTPNESRSTELRWSD